MTEVQQKLRICECGLHPICEHDQKRFNQLESEISALKQIIMQQKEQLESISQLVLNHFESIQISTDDS